VLKDDLGVCDFFRELSLLLEANLPLPDAIEQLARSANRREFQEVLLRISQETARGESLFQVLERFPTWFDPAQTRLIAAAEKGGALPEVLAQVSQNAEVEYRTLTHLRSAAAHPVFTVFMAVLISSGALLYAAPIWKQIFTDILGAGRIPSVSSLILNVSMILLPYRWVFLAVLLASAAVILWLFSNHAVAVRLLTRLLRRLPILRRVFMELESAMLCKQLSIMLGRNMPLTETLEIAARMNRSQRLSALLAQLAAQVRKGTAFKELLTDRLPLNGLIKMTLLHCPETRLSTDLDLLHKLFLDRTEVALARARYRWFLLLSFVSFAIAGVATQAMILPLIQMLNMFGGGC
jgi:type II secretory pathway component PulF